MRHRSVDYGAAVCQAGVTDDHIDLTIFRGVTSVHGRELPAVLVIMNQLVKLQPSMSPHCWRLKRQLSLCRRGSRCRQMSCHSRFTLCTVTRYWSSRNQPMDDTATAGSCRVSAPTSLMMAGAWCIKTVAGMAMQRSVGEGPAHLIQAQA